jgi:3-oxoadipate enol-lactonase
MTNFLIDGPSGPIAGSCIGDGPCLTLIAGLGATRGLWGELPGLLAKTFTVVTLDNRGIGGSRGGLPFTADGAAEDVWTVLDHLDHQTTALLGASLGGLIVLRAALSRPDRVNRMVIASTAARLTNHGRRSIGLLRDMLEHFPPEVFGRSLMTLGFGPPFHRRLPGFVDQTAQAYGLDPKDVPGCLAQAEHMLQGWDDRKALASLQVPALVLAGQRDSVVAWEDTAEISEALPHSVFVRAPDAGHSVLAEAGKHVFDRVVTFFEDNRAI